MCFCFHNELLGGVACRSWRFRNARLLRRGDKRLHRVLRFLMLSMTSLASSISASMSDAFLLFSLMPDSDSTI